MTEQSPLLLGILLGVSFSFVFFWFIAGIWAQTTYAMWSHIDGKEFKPQPPTSYFMFRGIVVLYKLLQNSKIELKFSK